MTSRLWPALEIVIAPDAGTDATTGEELVLASLDATGVSAVEECDTALRVFFSSAEERDTALALLQANPPVPLEVHAVDVPDEDWAARSQASLEPVRVGRVVLTPPWGVSKAAVDPGQADILTVVIQPSMGFGTGHHASTRLCTGLLQAIPVRERTVLDVGTGSGVLAIVASRLGGVRVVGIDNDPDAVESARENLDLNGLSSDIELRVGDFRALEGIQADVVTANLTGGLLVRGADALVSCVAPGGHLILSGVTLAEEAEVMAVFEIGLHLLERRGEDEWVGLLFERTPDPPR